MTTPSPRALWAWPAIIALTTLAGLGCALVGGDTVWRMLGWGGVGLPIIVAAIGLAEIARRR